MNNEIKEILDEMINLNDYEDYKIYGKRANEIGKLLLDYITNLQQIEQEHKKINGELREENSKLEIALQNIQEDYDRRVKENERLKETNVYCNRTDCVGRIKDSRKYDSVYQEKEDYKSRCEKAKNKLSFIDEALENDTLNVPLCIAKINSALNILQNGSEKDE